MNTIARPLARTRMPGFTLVELLVTIAMAAVLATIAIPSMKGLLDSARLTSSANALMSSLRLARSEAIKRVARVAVCRSVDGATCSAQGGWEQGWIVFHDPNGNGILDAGEAMIQRVDAVGGQLLVSGNVMVARHISFAPTGVSRTVSGGMQAGTVTLCHRSDRPAPARQVVISTGGRMRVTRTEVASCV